MPTEHERIERVLDGALPPESLAPQRLHRAMRHATLDGGKRLRARLVYATGRLFGLSMTQLDSAAAAVEMIHAYSLIHDDLPAMDDDALRRGKPTVHIAFDEATAILAGDALQALAYETLTRAEWTDAAKLAALQELISASGSRGMCGGQQLDMDAGGKSLSLADLQNVHALKTGMLIKATIRLPAIVADADSDARAALDAFADDLGLAFQIGRQRRGAGQSHLPGPAGSGRRQSPIGRIGRTHASASGTIWRACRRTEVLGGICGFPRALIRIP